MIVELSKKEIDFLLASDDILVNMSVNPSGSLLMLQTIRKSKMIESIRNITAEEVRELYKKLENAVSANSVLKANSLPL